MKSSIKHKAALAFACAASAALCARANTVMLTPVADSEIRQFPSYSDLNYGTLTDMVAGELGANSGFTTRRGLLRFDLSGAIPSGAVINSVTVQVVAVVRIPSAAANGNFGLHALLESWSETEVTWNSRLTGVHWQAPGASGLGDSVPTPSSVVFVSGLGTYVFQSTSNLVADVQGWVNNPSANFGWVFIGEDATPYTARHFATREDPNNAPILAIDFSLPPPTIVTQPTNQTVFVGSTAILSVGAAGASPLAYQWQFGGTAIAGATNATLVLDNVQTNQSGVYSVVVTNSIGSTNSQPATLTVVPALGLFVKILAPTNGEAFPEGASVALLAQATNGMVVQVQFFLGTNSVGIVTNAPYGLLLTNPPPGTNVLTAVATDAQGTNAISSPVTFIIRRPPLVILSVSPAVARLGTSITNTATVQTDGKVTSVSFFQGSTLLGETNQPPFRIVWIPDTNRLYTLTAVAMDDLGQSGTSAPVTLKVFVPDSTLPVITLVTAPQNYARQTTATVWLAGTASDNIGLDHVEYHVDSGPFLATIGNLLPVPGTTNWAGLFPLVTSTNWTAIVPLFPGNNALRVRSVDFAGNPSIDATRFLTYVVTNTLIVRTQGIGAVSPDLNGQSLELGQIYSVTAQPGPNQIFARWDGVTTSTSAALSFVMSSNLVLTANFVTNPFPPLAGTYASCIPDTNQPSGSSGTVTLQLSSLGAFSGSLGLGGAGYSFSGQFDARGKAILPILRSGQTPIALALQLDLSGFTGQITGSATNVVGTNLLVSQLLAKKDGVNSPAVAAVAHIGNSVVISWSACATGYILQSSSSLTSPAWTPVTSPQPQLVGGQLTVTIPITGGARYFRLARGP